MSGRLTRSTLRDAVEQIQSADQPAGDNAENVTVLWNIADPENRPQGMTWVPENNTLTYDVWDAQREALQTIRSDADITGFLAGYGSGKTIFGARWLIKQALEYDGSRFLGMGIDFTKARDTTFRVLFEQLPGDRTSIVTSSYNGPETSPVVADYNRQNHRLTFINDSVIKLGSADKWNRYAGDSYGGVWLDEPSHYGEDLHDLLEMIGSRLRGVAGPKVQLWTLTGNGYNAAFEILERQEDSNGDSIGLNIESVRASTLENPYLDAGETNRFERQYGGTSREEQALHGGFAAAQGLVYSNFARDTHVVPHSDALDRVREDWRIYGYDAGWNDPRVLLEIGKTDYGQLIVLDEFYQSESHVSDAIDWLKRGGKPRGTIYSEHEPADIEKLKAADYPTKKADKSIDAGIDEMRNRLESDSSDQPGLLVSDNCENWIQEVLGYKEEHVGSSTATDHALDATRYAVMGDAADSRRMSSTVASLGSGDSSDKSSDSRDGVNLNNVAKQSAGSAGYGKW